MLSLYKLLFLLFWVQNWALGVRPYLKVTSIAQIITLHCLHISKIIYFLLLFHSYFLFLCCFCCTIGLVANGGHVGNGSISGRKREDYAEFTLIGLRHIKYLTNEKEMK